MRAEVVSILKASRCHRDSSSSTSRRADYTSRSSRRRDAIATRCRHRTESNAGSCLDLLRRRDAIGGEADESNARARARPRVQTEFPTIRGYPPRGSGPGLPPWMHPPAAHAHRLLHGLDIDQGAPRSTWTKSSGNRVSRTPCPSRGTHRLPSGPCSEQIQLPQSARPGSNRRSLVPQTSAMPLRHGLMGPAYVRRRPGRSHATAPSTKKARTHSTHSGGTSLGSNRGPVMGSDFGLYGRLRSFMAACSGVRFAFFELHG